MLMMVSGVTIMMILIKNHGYPGVDGSHARMKLLEQPSIQTCAYAKVTQRWVSDYNQDNHEDKE